MKPHVSQTHTHADTWQKQRLHKPQEPNIAVAHFLTGVFAKKKKKSSAKKPHLIGCMGSYPEMALWIFGNVKS